MKYFILLFSLLIAEIVFAEQQVLSPKIPSETCRFQYVENGKPVALEFRYRKDLANPALVKFEQIIKYASEFKPSQEPKYKAFVFNPPSGSLIDIFPDFFSTEVSARKKAEAHVDATKTMFHICDASKTINIVGSIQSLALKGIEFTAFDQDRKEAKPLDPKLGITTIFPDGHELPIAVSIVEINRLATLSRNQKSSDDLSACRNCAPGAFFTDKGALTPANKEQILSVPPYVLEQNRIEAVEARDKAQRSK